MLHEAAAKMRTHFDELVRLLTLMERLQVIQEKFPVDRGCAWPGLVGGRGILEAR